jgi:hypothetical protein
VSFYAEDTAELQARTAWLRANNADALALKYGIRRDLWLVALLADVAEEAARNDLRPVLQQLQDWGWSRATALGKRDASTLEGIKRRCRRAASVLTRMEQTSRKIARSAEPLPSDRTTLVSHGKVSIISLAGYTGDFQAAIYSLVAEELFSARVSSTLPYPVLLVLEEAHNFVPPKANSPAEQQSIQITKQIAQEGRKFGVGLVLISQRPSRLDETTLSQCNSYIIMKMMNPADQSFVQRVIETIGEDEAKMLPDLDVGEALLAGQFINFPVLVRIKPPASQGEREEDDAFVELARAHADQQRQKTRT